MFLLNCIIFLLLWIALTPINLHSLPFMWHAHIAWEVRRLKLLWRLQIAQLPWLTTSCCFYQFSPFISALWHFFPFPPTISLELDHLIHLHLLSSFVNWGKKLNFFVHEIALTLTSSVISMYTRMLWSSNFGEYKYSIIICYFRYYHASQVDLAKTDLTRKSDLNLLENFGF